MIDETQGKGANGKQKGPGEQIRERENGENSNLDNLRGAEANGGQSSEVRQHEGRAGTGSGTDDVPRDSSPLSTPSEGSPDERPTEDDLAKRQSGGPTSGDK